MKPNLLEYQLSQESQTAKSRAAKNARTNSCMEKIFLGALTNDERTVLHGCLPSIDVCYFHNSTVRPRLKPFYRTGAIKTVVKRIITEGGCLALNCNRGEKWCRVLHWAVESENIRLIVMAVGHEGVDIDQRDWFNRTALHLANSKCNPALTEFLLKAGANVNAVDGKGTKPLHYAISRWKAELKKNNSQQLDDSVKVLNQNIEAALAWKEEYFMENIPLLHFAVECRHLGVIETLLITRKGDVNVRDGRGRTALFVAFEHKLLDMIDLLILKYGADESLTEETGQRYNYVVEQDYRYLQDFESLWNRVSNIPSVEREGHHHRTGLARSDITRPTSIRSHQPGEHVIYKPTILEEGQTFFSDTASTNPSASSSPAIVQYRLQSMTRGVVNGWWEEEEEKKEEFIWEDWYGENGDF